MGLWRDLNDPLVRAIVGMPVDTGWASSDTSPERERVVSTPHTPHTAEERHIALLYGEPQDGGEVAAAARLDALPDGGTEDDLDREVVRLYSKPYAERVPFDDDEVDAWFDLGTCGGCGAYGRLGRVHYAKGTECGEYI